MTRKLALAVAVAALMISGRVFALGLGEITLHSALNQKLDAEIELLEVRGLESTEILASLGSREDFQRVGVERFFFLTDLQFKVEMRADGGAVLRVTSSQPITEPYLNFLVEVLWPSGRLLKEFTVLLDPPTFTERAAPAVSAPARGDPGGGPAGRVERGPTRPDSQVSFRPPSGATPTPRPAPEERVSGDTYGMTDRDDTLWAIAQRTRPSGAVSVQQTMLAIARMNPEAFIGGNINLLKAGYRLQLPTEGEALALTQNQAVSEVAAHNSRWQAYRSGGGLAALGVAPPTEGAPRDETGSALAGQIDATRAPSGETPAPAGPEGELRIVAADDTAGGQAAGGAGAEMAGEIQTLNAELATSEEERDRIAMENDELVYRLDQMTAQVQQLERQLEVRDQQIAQLQQQAAAGVAAPEPVQPKQTGEEEAGGGLMGLLASPLVVIGAGVVVVLLLVLALVAARRRRAEAADSLEVYEEVETPVAYVDETPVVAAAEEPVFGATLPDEFDEEEEFPAAAEAEGEEEQAVAAVEEETGAPQTSDVIGEADIYIAYGRYPQAVSLLLSAIDEDPDRSEVRLKLLEVYAETRDEQGFEQHMGELVDRCDDEDILLAARELEGKLRGDDAAEVAGDSVMLDAGPAEVSGEPGAVDDFELTLEDEEPRTGTPSLELVSSESPDEEASRRGDDLGGDLGMDFDPDADESSEDAVVEGAQSRLEAADEPAPSEPAEDLEFNLDDLELDTPTETGLESISEQNAATLVRPAESDVEPAAEEEVEDAFDFLDEEDAASTKLDLARAYIDMGDEDGAREILTEVVSEGTGEQQEQANALLERLSG